MTTPDPTIQIDMKTRVIRSGDTWLVQRLQPDGHYDMVDHWQGNRRSLMRWLEDNNVHPTREAEQQLAQLPERKSFPADTIKKAHER